MWLFERLKVISRLCFGAKHEAEEVREEFASDGEDIGAVEPVARVSLISRSSHLHDYSGLTEEKYAVEK